MKTYVLAVLVTLIMSGAVVASPLMLNGEFELGNVYFTSGYTYVEPTGNGVLYPEGFYTVTTNPNQVHNLFSSFGDHTTGQGNMMVVIWECCCRYGRMARPARPAPSAWSGIYIHLLGCVCLSY